MHTAKSSEGEALVASTRRRMHRRPGDVSSGMGNRGRFSFSILLVVLCLLPLGAAALPAHLGVAASRLPIVKEVGSIGLTVSDMDRSVEFFSKVLSFEKVSEVEVAGEPYERLQGIFGLRIRVVRMRLGDESIELMEFLSPKGRPIPVDSRSNDRWFQHIAIIVSDMDRAYQWLRQKKVQHASSGPQRLPDWNKKAGGIEAFYFKDPDGHPLEILHFPPDKGLAKWRRSTDQVFLGIDHTAIVVADTESSLKFYRGTLGLKLVGESENYGTEQEHLNNVFGARLRITSLRADQGPGIEFLEYLSPRDGRPLPPDQGANDVTHWQTRLIVDDTDGIARNLLLRRFVFVSPGIIALPDGALGFARALLVRDPDGHAVQLVAGRSKNGSVSQL